MMDCTIMDNQTPSSTEELGSSEEKEVRNWDELPPDVLSHVFLKLGAIDILLRVQSVCSTWRRASKEPLLFRSIDMRHNRWDLVDANMYDMEKMAREAVDRSCGQLVEFSIEHFYGDECLAYIADKSGELRCLRLVFGYQDSNDALINMAKKAVMLEELELCYCSFSVDALKAVGNACPRLKSFRLNNRYLSRVECDAQALAIAQTMPELRHLHLFGNKLTNAGLKAILDGCLHLESLDIRKCFNVNLEGYLLKSCGDRLIKVRLPNDSTDDYEFDAAIYYGSDDDYEFDGAIYYGSDDVFSDISELDRDNEFGHHSDSDLGHDNGFDSGIDFDDDIELFYEAAYYD